MDSLKTRTRQDLLNDLIFQHPVSAASFMQCLGCKDHKSRSGWYCKECIKKELLDRGLSETKLNDLLDRLVDVQRMHQEIREMSYALTFGKK